MKLENNSFMPNFINDVTHLLETKKPTRTSASRKEDILYIQEGISIISNFRVDDINSNLDNSFYDKCIKDHDYYVGTHYIIDGHNPIFDAHPKLKEAFDSHQELCILGKKPDSNEQQNIYIPVSKFHIYKDRIVEYLP